MSEQELKELNTKITPQKVEQSKTSSRYSRAKSVSSRSKTSHR